MKNLLVFLSLFLSQICLAQLPKLEVGAKKQVKLEKLHVKVTVTGNIATTEYDMLFYNPNKNLLSGKFTMPLTEGQEISRYALDINGKMREGVIVEKVKARQAFEAVVRQNIDPGIINKTKGNNFSTEIYPIPAKGNKRVIIATTETLDNKDNKLHYTLPLKSQNKIADFSLKVEVLKNTAQDSIVVEDFKNIVFDNTSNAYLLSFTRKDYKPKEPLHFTVPLFQEKPYQVFTEKKGDSTYFYIHYKIPKLHQQPKPEAKHIMLYWDCSLSADERNIEKELALIENYLSNNKEKKVTVITFNYKASTPKEFKIKTDVSALISYLKGLNNDGATQLEAIKIENKGDEVLLFSDGVATLGTPPTYKLSVPLYTITSSFGADYNWLKQTAKQNNGVFINLNKLSAQEALLKLSSQNNELPKLRYKKNELGEIYQKPGEIVGVLKKGKANIIIDYSYNQYFNFPLSINQSEKDTILSIPIIANRNNPVARIWAIQKITELLLNEKKNTKQILALSQAHSIITKHTSMLVLDRVEDYARHHIQPPAELLEKYKELIAEETKNKEQSKKDIYTDNIERIEQLKEWYNNPPKVKKKEKVHGATAGTVVEDAVIQMQAEESTLDEVVLVGYAPGIRVRGVSSLSNEDKEYDDNTNKSIKVLAWLPDAPYMKEIRKATNFEIIYSRLKATNKLRPAFYIQVADWLFSQNRSDEAIRVLSNILELDLENPELLKVAAHRLLQEKQTQLAIKLFKEIKELRPEEPQSFRDLAHAYESNKEYQKALATYLHILETSWLRFEDIKDIVFNEINTLIALHKKELNLTQVPKSYIYAMPLDVRIVIDWSSNDNDIDLWVIDPNGEKCYYQNSRTSLGGKISSDFTAGYGPEEFSLKKGKRGIYTIYANYFSESRQSITGPVTIYAKLYINYGKKNEKMQPIAIQLDDTKETHQLGQLLFE